MSVVWLKRQREGYGALSLIPRLSVEERYDIVVSVCPTAHSVCMCIMPIAQLPRCIVKLQKAEIDNLITRYDLNWLKCELKVLEWSSINHIKFMTHFL